MKLVLQLSIVLAAFLTEVGFAQDGSEFRPPAVPLVVHDPYLSIWSMSDKLSDQYTKHWTEANNELFGMVKIDGTCYRFSKGWPQWNENLWGRPSPEAMEQESVEVTPTRTIYHFTASGVHLTMTFTTPILTHDFDILSRPITYISWEVKSIDEREHKVQLYFEASSEIAVDQSNQNVVSSRFNLTDLDVLRVGTKDQDILKKWGDNVRIDWGYLYLVAARNDNLHTVLSDAFDSRISFIQNKNLNLADQIDDEGVLHDKVYRRGMPVLALSYDFGTVADQSASFMAMLAYDDLYSIEYMNQRMRPYWNRNNTGIGNLLALAHSQYDSLKEACIKFDHQLIDDLTNAGGIKYAKVASLAYRQAFAGHKLVSNNKGVPYYFSKENFSNGSIATVDVTYPSAPIFLYLNPELLRAMLLPILEYAATDRWKFDFAPHDLGKYPLANGQLYGGGEYSEEYQMPVEESGNMLILTAVLTNISGNTEFISDHWSVLKTWADFLVKNGLDPINQLCTDDFTGHLAHNTNLSIKAILAIRSFAYLCEVKGDGKLMKYYKNEAELMANIWEQKASDGDHYKLAFDQSGTWSQKYNLIWDQVLDFRLFPVKVIEKEIAYYKQQQNTYGLPLDSRSDLTKLDWIYWTAALTNNKEDFQFFTDPVYDFLHKTSDRVPMTDCYFTESGRKRSFQARSVVGGVYMNLLKKSMQLNRSK